MKIIKREEYLNRLISLKNTPDIKIITGMRRSGKSELVKSYIEYLINDVNNNIIYIDYADISFDNIKEYKLLNEYVNSKYLETKNNILIIDEIQLCEKFEIAINSFHASKKFDIYITGSNAFLLSSDLATFFTGRYIEIPVYPFSYKEFLKYFEISNSKESFDKYLSIGGLAGNYLYNDEQNRIAYVKNIYDTILKRDLIDKYNLSNETLLYSISQYLIDNISNITTSSNIANVLKANKYLTNHNTVSDYISYMCNAFIFYKVRRYDIHGKKYLQTYDKYYLSDPSIKYYLQGKRNTDYGRMYENIVAIELLRRGYEIYIGKLYEKEIDFVALKNNEKVYIQVSDQIDNEETLDRELSPLKKIKDCYPKILLANTSKPEYDIDGIKVINIADWLNQ